MNRPLVAVSVALLAGGITAQRPDRAASKPMSFSNRLLLNRAAVNGVARLEVLLAVAVNAIEAGSRHVERLGGRIRFRDATVGYVRADVPTGNLLAIVSDERIEAYQIASMSRASWYRDGPPPANAEMYRGFERAIPDMRPQPERPADLPALSRDRARQSGYTADEDAGVRRWLEAHPTYDGRGVTIALLETAQPEFTSPIFAHAKSLAGYDVRKLAGIVNAIGSDEPDDTRVTLDVEVVAPSAWHRIGDRTFVLPRRGRYRFGLFTFPLAVNLISQFGVLQDEATGELWVDANGNADFRDERAVADVNEPSETLDVRTLKIPSPRASDIAFVMGRGSTPHTVHLYLGRGGHQTMTASVAAGSQTNDSLAYCVAPGARLLLVRSHTPDFRLRDLIEGFLIAAKRPDVDVLSDSSGILMVPDTAADFVGLLLDRIVAAYGKPIFHAAGNMSLFLGSVSSLGA